MVSRKELAKQIPGLRPWEVLEVEQVMDLVTYTKEWYREDLGEFTTRADYEQDWFESFQVLLSFLFSQIKQCFLACLCSMPICGIWELSDILRGYLKLYTGSYLDCLFRSHLFWCRYLIFCLPGSHLNLRSCIQVVISNSINVVLVR